MKFIPLILLLFATLSNATEIGCGYNFIPKYGAPINGSMYKEDDFYTYKLAFDRENELYMYRFRKNRLDIEKYGYPYMEVYHYARVHNNYEIFLYKESSTQVFYKFACAQTFPTFIYPLKKFDYSDDPKIANARFIVDVFAYDTHFAVQRCNLGYDLANHKCADDCEHITDRELRFNCACNKQFPGSKYTGAFSTDPDVCKTPNITFTPKCCFSCGNGNSIVVNAANEYADYGCNYDEIDHLYLDDPKKPDDNKTKPDKPDNNNTKPNKPDKPSNPDDNKTKPNKPDHGGGGHSGGGGGGGNPDNPDKPGDDDKDKDKNGTHPGGGGGGNSGGKDDDKSGAAPDISSDLEKGINDSAKSFDSAYGDYKSKFDGLVSDIKGAIGKIKDGGFTKFGKGREMNCPITSKTIDFKYFQTSFTYDWCEFLSRFYYVFYFLSLCTCLFFGLKFTLVHTFHIGGGSE